MFTKIMVPSTVKDSTLENKEKLQLLIEEIKALERIRDKLKGS